MIERGLRDIVRTSQDGGERVRSWRFKEALWSSAATNSKSKDMLMTWQIRRVTEHVRDHLTEEIDVSTLAALTRLQRARFFANFKYSFGHTPLAYLRHLRLVQARHLLLDTRMSITAVSAAVGLEPTRLATAFKRVYGITPSAFRASNECVEAITPGVVSGDTVAAEDRASSAAFSPRRPDRRSKSTRRTNLALATRKASSGTRPAIDDIG